MIANTALAGLMLALIALLYASAVILFKRSDDRWVESARRAVQSASLLVSLALGLFVYLLLTNRVEFAAVYRVTRSTMSAVTRLTALWGGQTGSLLFWTWLLGMVALVTASVSVSSDSRQQPWLLFFGLLPFAGFLSLVLFLDNPFSRWWLLADGSSLAAVFLPGDAVTVMQPADGIGLNPLLRHPAMVLHPPVLYLGFTIFALPFAQAMAGLMTGIWNRDVLASIRRSTLVGWFFLTLGLILGSRWAYDVLGWGGYWGWDPVEIAGLLPWLTSSAALHLLAIRSRTRRRDVLILGVVLLTFCLVILGSFLTRSGILTSVHTFADSPLSPALLVLFTGVSLVSLVIWILSMKCGEKDHKPGSLSFWNVILDGSAVVLILLLVICLVGLSVPVVGEWVTGRAMIVGPAYYRQATGPLWMLLLVLTALSPLFPRRIALRCESLRAPGIALLMAVAVGLLARGALALSSGEISVVMAMTMYLLLAFLAVREGRLTSPGSHKPRVRFIGVVLIHLGVFFFASGVAGMEGQETFQATLSPGERMTAEDYSIRLDDISRQPVDEYRNVTVASVSIYDRAPDAIHRIAEVYPGLEEDLVYEQVRALPGVASSVSRDIYVLFTAWNVNGSASLRVLVNPLANCLWIGGLLMAAGALVVMIPDVFRHRNDDDLNTIKKAGQTGVADNFPGS